MRTDISQDFLDQTRVRGRQPFQVLQFKFTTVLDGPVYHELWLSDNATTCLGNECYPVVEDWGTINDTIDISQYMVGLVSGSRQVGLSLLNTVKLPLFVGTETITYLADFSTGGVMYRDEPPAPFTSEVGRVPLWEFVLGNECIGADTLTYLADTKVWHFTGLHRGRRQDEGFSAQVEHFIGEPIVDYPAFIATPDTIFSGFFRWYQPENIEVVLYQGFLGIPDADAIILDSFLIQDPISFSENSSLLSLDLVSKNLYADPFIDEVQADNIFHGVLIGTSSSITTTVDPDNYSTSLTAAVTATATTINVVSTTDFAASGTLVIDNEKTSYSSKSATSFLGCVRETTITQDWSGRMPHADGTSVYQHGVEYVYVMDVLGPLSFIGSVFVDGVIYEGQYTTHPELTAPEIRFLHSPPFEIVAGTITVTETGHRIEDIYYLEDPVGDSCIEARWGDTTALENDTKAFELLASPSFWEYKASSTSALSASGLPLHSEFVSSEVLVQYNGHIEEDLWIESDLEFRFFPRNNPSKFTQKFISHKNTDGNETFDTSVLGWVFVTDKSTSHVFYSAGGLDQCWWYGTRVNSVKVSVTHRPTVRTHSDNVTAEAGSHVPDNPADSIKWVLDRMGIGSGIDQASFDVARNWYDANSYVFQGWIPGDMRTREALKQMLLQCRSRLIFNAGKMKLIVRSTLSNAIIQKTFTTDNVRQKSISITRENVDSITNHITTRYNATTADQDYQDSFVTKDDDSIAKFGKHERLLDMFLVTSTAMAAGMASFYRAELKDPHSFITFQAYIEAIELERDDGIMLFTPFNEMDDGAWCKIAYTNRIFGSGKNKQINLYEITCYTTDDLMAEGTVIELMEDVVIDDTDLSVEITPATVIELTESAVVDDTDLLAENAVRTIYLSEDVVVDDTGLITYVTDCAPDGYGTCGYGFNPYGE